MDVDATQSPGAEPFLDDYPRIIWQMTPEEYYLYRDSGLPAKYQRLLEDVRHPRGGEPAPLFDLTEDQAAELSARLTDEEKSDPRNALELYFHAYLADPDDLPPLRRKLLQESPPDAFEIQWRVSPERPAKAPRKALSAPAAPPQAPPTSAALLAAPTLDFTGLQTYLDGSVGGTTGIDARACWGLLGGRGDGLVIADVEKGWNLNHEDAPGQIAANGPIEDWCHGTAVLGVLAAPHNGFGVSGIVPDTAVRVESILFQAQMPNPEWAMLRAALELPPGSILLVEAMAKDSEQAPWLPIEAWQVGRVVSRLVVRYLRIHVIAAAGQQDPPDPGVRLTLPDSGAILVGGGKPQSGDRVLHSNFGPRVDLQGWGEGVATTGGQCNNYDTLTFNAEHDRCYMHGFHGTSSASAIVAGAAACVAAVAKAHGLGELEPDYLRSLLQRTGSFAPEGANAEIGPLPNLPAALRTLASDKGIVLQPSP